MLPYAGKRQRIFGANVVGMRLALSFLLSSQILFPLTISQPASAFTQTNFLTMSEVDSSYDISNQARKIQQSSEKPVGRLEIETPMDDQEVDFVTCVSLRTGYQTVSKLGKCRERAYRLVNWFTEENVLEATPNSKLQTLNVCKSKKTEKVVIRKKCNARTEKSSTFVRHFGQPGQMLSPVATMDLLGTALIGFSPPINDGGGKISHYTVTATPGDLQMIVMPKDIKRARFVDLTPGVFYSFSVSATNSQGTSVQSVKSGELRAHTLPTSPIITSIVRTGPTTARIYFDPSLLNGGAEVSRFSLFLHVNGNGAVPINSALFTPGILDVFDLPSSSSLAFSMTASSVAGSSIHSIISETITTPASPVVSPSQPPSTDVPVSVAPVNTIISSPSIGGVTAPVTGATPVTTITETAQYTGTVSWSGSPVTFASATIYTATITLTAKSGFTLTGVASDFFTVAGSTSDTNTASSQFSLL